MLQCPGRLQVKFNVTAGKRHGKIIAISCNPSPHLARSQAVTSASSPSKVISLTRTPERRTEFARRNPHLNYVYFDAVDGKTLTRESVAATGLFPPGLPYTRGAYGAALSHLALWEETIARN